MIAHLAAKCSDGALSLGSVWLTSQGLDEQSFTLAAPCQSPLDRDGLALLADAGRDCIRFLSHINE